MLNNQQKAEAVIAGLEENSPQLLAQLAKAGQLEPLIRQRVAAYNLEYARRMKGMDPREGPLVSESLLPMLNEFPKGTNLRPLTQDQTQAVLKQLDLYLQKSPRPLLQQSPSSAVA